MPSVFFYISGHGFGHASRQSEIINAFGARTRGAIDIVVRTSAPAWLFELTSRVPFTFAAGPVGTGVVQIDSLHQDETATIAHAAAFYATLADRAREEAAMLRAAGARLVVADVPPLGCAAAHAAGIPSVVCSNFTWDWIYQGFGERLNAAPGLVDIIQDAYRHAEAGWRLPMHGGFERIAPLIDLPLVARHARHARVEVRQQLGLPLDRALVLSSFGGYGLDRFDPCRLDCLDRFGVVITARDGAAIRRTRGLHFVDETRLYASGLRYEDLIAAVDVVATKPGYGIISECVANETAMLYTSRGRFAEYDVLVAEMPRYLRCRFIDHEALFEGRWGAAVDDLLASPPPLERPATNGADVVADMIVRRLA